MIRLSVVLCFLIAASTVSAEVRKSDCRNSVRSVDNPFKDQRKFSEIPLESFAFENLPRLKLDTYTELLASSPRYAILAAQIDEVFERLDKLYGEFSDIRHLKERYELVVTASPVGPLVSLEGSLGVFLDWKTTDPISDSVLAHEIGHELVHGWKTYGTLSAYDTLSDYKVFDEFIADWTALKTVGNLDLKAQGVDFRGLELRNPDLISYDRDASFFLQESGYAPINKWLGELKARPVLSRSEKALLKGIGDQVPAGPPLAGRSLLAEDKNFNEYDTHALGVPLLFFFRDFEKKVGRDVGAEFMKALKDLSDQKTTDLHYVGYLKGYEKKTREGIRFSVKSPRHLLETFRKRLNASERKIFDGLDTERSITRGLLMEEKFSNERIAISHIRDEIWSRFHLNDGKGQGIYNPKNQYAHPEYGVRHDAPIVLEKIL